MSRARLWISSSRAASHAFIVEHNDGRQECYPLKSHLSREDRLGSSYPGDFRGHPGAYYDLPFGFPTDNATAQQRLSDPSIPSTMKKLIQDNFPLNNGRKSQGLTQPQVA